MKIKLLVLHAGEPKREVLLTEFPALVGRGAGARVHLVDRFVSREHCEIDEMGGQLVIRDFDSKHGTFVNGLRVDKTVLFPGDRIAVGGTRLRVCDATMNAREKGSELEEKCEFEPHSEQVVPACRSSRTDLYRQGGRPSLIQSVRRMLTRHGKHTVGKSKKPTAKGVPEVRRNTLSSWRE